MQTLLQDLRYSARMLLKKPGFTLIAVLTLALGIGANTAMFSLLDALFWRAPSMVDEPRQLIGVFEAREGRIRSYEGISYADFTDYRRRSAVFADLAASSNLWLYLSTGDKAGEVYGRAVSSNYFPLLGVKPLLGRFFAPEEDAAPNQHPVAVLSHQFWQSHFNGDPQIVGQTIRMNRTAFTVIGVAPARFKGLFANEEATIWIPLMMGAPDRGAEDFFSRKNGWLGLVGRLKPGRTMDEARAELQTTARQLETAYPDTNKGLSVDVAPISGVYPQEQAAAAKQSVIFIASLIGVLLIACANIAGLLLARGAARRKEIAVRLALGAGRWRVVRQLLTESLMLALLGGAAGLLVAVWSTELFKAFYSWHDFGLNPSVLGGAMILSLITGLVFGLAPALQATSIEVSPALKDDALASGSRESRLRGALTVAQVALSLVLLVGAGLLLNSLRSVIAHPGYDASRIAHFRLRPGRIGYDAPRAQVYYRELIRRLETLPGVQSVALAVVAPSGSWAYTHRVSLPGQSPASEEDAVKIESNDVTPGFFGKLKLPLLKGREFDEGDRGGAPLVTIINETLARRLWPAGAPLGGAMLIDGKPYTVIGIAKDHNPSKSDEAPKPYLYLSFWQREVVDSRLFVRVAGDPTAMLAPLRRELATVDPEVHIGQEMSLIERTKMTYQTERLMSSLLSSAGLLALFLSAVGLYGVLASTVERRTREIGIRVALGARAADVLMLALRQGLQLALIGIALGLSVAFAVTRFLSSYLYGVTARDPLTFAGVSLLLVIVSLLACYVPARRATKVDPMIALRAE